MGGTIINNVGSYLRHYWQIIDMKNGCRDYFSGRIEAGCAREYIYFCYGSVATVDCVHGPHNPIMRPLNRLVVVVVAMVIRFPYSLEEVTKVRMVQFGILSPDEIANVSGVDRAQ
ncbi:unnamed protein product [Camellia sinensis]